MSLILDDTPDTLLAGKDTSGIGFDLQRNTATTIGVVVGSGTVLAGGALVTAALPVQMLSALGISGLCLFIGDRQAKDLPVNPFQPKVETMPKISG